jgi:hypothetical protein
MPLPGAKFISVIQLSALCGLSESAIHAALRNGLLKRIKVGRKTLIAMTDIENFLSNRDAPAASAPESPRATPGPDPACQRCQGRIFWRTNARPGWTCKRCIAPGRLARQGGYTETASVPA